MILIRTLGRLRNVILMLIAVLSLAACTRHETICECTNYHIGNGEMRKHYLLAKRIKKDDARKQCDSFQLKGKYRFDTCVVTIIK